MKHAVRVMIPSRHGSIVAMASICGCIGGVASQAYTSSKHNIVELVRNAVVELGPLRIRVNIGTIFKPQDVVEVVLYLGSCESKYVSRHDLVVDEGLTVVNHGLCVFRQSV
ncbi:hypothetical protein JHK87_007024 [Glycine soja]|nr:hypothetical protein JHK87_007024 [Glycine soja]